METSPDTSPVPLSLSVILQQCQQRTAKRTGEEARPNYMPNHRTLYSLDNPLNNFPLLLMNFTYIWWVNVILKSWKWHTFTGLLTYMKRHWVVCSFFVTLKARNRWLQTRDIIFSESALMLSFRYFYLQLSQTDIAIKISNHIYFAAVDTRAVKRLLLFFFCLRNTSGFTAEQWDH